jgi:hypothetical protein
MSYIIEPTTKNTVVDYDTWSNGYQTVITARYWQWIEVEFPSSPVIEYDNPNELNVSKLLDNDIYPTLFDCYHSAVVEYPKGMRTTLRDRLDELWEKTANLDSDGWYIVSNEIWIHGEWILKQII